MKIKFNTILMILAILAVGGFIGKYLYMLPGFSDGEAAPNFKATTLSGEAFELNQLEGDYVLVDFWGSWCGPCRAESPELVKLYQTYKGKKLKNGGEFQVVGVAIEKDAKRWKRAIKQDGLDWPYHVLDQAENLRFFDSPIAVQFGVKEVPTKYLINPKGNIALVNPSFKELTQILEEQLQ